MTPALRALALSTAAMALAAGTPSSAATGHRAHLTLVFSSRSVSTSTGVHVRLQLTDPANPGGKAPQLVKAIVALPTGTAVATGSAPQCTASDTALTLEGALACPDNSRVGSGTVQGDTGFGAPFDPISGDDHVFNGPGQIIEVVTFPGMPFAVGFDRLIVSGSTLTAHPPAPPGGPPDGRIHVSAIDFTIPLRAGYLTTPPTCPRSGVWTTTGRFVVADGVTDTATTTTPCRRPGR
jgi:hypothetical protein